MFANGITFIWKLIEGLLLLILAIPCLTYEYTRKILLKVLFHPIPFIHSIIGEEINTRQEEADKLILLAGSADKVPR